MKLWKKIVLIVISIPIVAGIMLTGVYLYADNKADIHKGYQTEIETGGDLEKQYLSGGEYQTKKTTVKKLKILLENIRFIIQKSWKKKTGFIR